VGCFALAPADDLLFVDEVQLISQECTVMTVAFDDDAVADFFDQQVDRGLRPEQFARIWIHTHPGNSPEPSLTDERTFDRVFGKADWAVMFVLARGGQTYARLSFNIGPGGAMTIPTRVDYGRPFGGSDAASWEEEYQANVIPAPVLPLSLPETWGGGFGLENFANEEAPWPDEVARQGEDDHDFDFERFLI
jgi:proteasome lid subunit RPN8/RPN11